MRSADLHLIPLGGTGEIGMNLNVYHHQGKWLVVDCGVMFERDGPHRTHALFPDIRFLEDKRDDLLGIVLTHAHQDHLGAVRDLWRRLRCPVFGTRFAIEMLKGPLSEVGLADTVPCKVLPERERFSLGPFDLERVPLTHSTVEMGALVIRTRAGTVLHTGDWKIDPEPVVGSLTDKEALKRLADEPVHAVVSDSTNALREGWTPSEGTLLGPLTRLVSEQPRRVAVTLFSSNIARLHTLAQVAKATDRHLCLMGRSLRRTVEAAKAVGYLPDFEAAVDLKDFGFLPPENVMLLCTGSQGEPRAALTRLAEDRLRGVHLEEGDSVLFSARKIPGCEGHVDRMVRLFRERGVRVLDHEGQHIHVSGHPSRDELRTLYDWVQPTHVVPVHGTPAHLDAHADLAEEEGWGALRIRNGHILRLGPDPAIIGSVPTGRVRRVERTKERWVKQRRQWKNNRRYRQFPWDR